MASMPLPRPYARAWVVGDEHAIFVAARDRAVGHALRAIRGLCFFSPAVLAGEGPTRWAYVTRLDVRRELLAAHAAGPLIYPGVHVLPAMRRRRWQQLQILNAVVQLVAINMMHLFIAGQRTTKLLRHDMAMQINILAANIDLGVPML